ncbi:MAG: hypothetical protein OXU71_00345 [Gammaproteobacteria bacterium]|nr:hypothetical protein [Gammaproteobacteria bacterium]
MLIAPSAIREICRKTDRRLWNAYGIHEGKSRPEEPFSRLLFPTDANGDIRVSEQEARFAFLESVLESGFFYSVETPTNEQYQFKGEYARAAQTDFTILDKTNAHTLNVEFKKDTDIDTQDDVAVYKDVQKLLRESAPGMWFHLVESVNTETLGKILYRLCSEFSKGLQMPELNLNGKSKAVFFHVCVLRHGFSIHKRIDFSQSSDSHEGEFSFSYNVSRQRFNGSSNPNKWDVHQNNY